MTIDSDVSVIAAEVRDRSAVVIGGELRRLAGRARGLRQSDLDIVETSLNDLVERLILTRLRVLPHRAEQLGRLFDVVRAD